MKIPETYEEFLKTPDEVLLNISKLKLSLEEAKLLISYINKADLEFRNKIISEEKRKSAKSIWERYCCE